MGSVGTCKRHHVRAGMGCLYPFRLPSNLSSELILGFLRMPQGEGSSRGAQSARDKYKVKRSLSSFSFLPKPHSTPQSLFLDVHV